MTLKEALEKRNALIPEMKKLNDAVGAENRSYTAEEQTKWTAMNSDLDRLEDFIDKAQRLSEIDQRAAQTVTSAKVTVADIVGSPAARKVADEDGVTEDDRNLAFQAWAMVQWDMKPSEAGLAACRKLGINPGQTQYVSRMNGNMAHVRDVLQPGRERRTDYYVSTGTGYGGETIPTGFMYELERAMLTFGGMLQACRILRTPTGNDMVWPTSNDTSNAGVQINEVVDSTVLAMTEQTVATSSVTLKAWDFGSKIIRVTRDLLQDSAFDFASLIGQIIGERLGRIINTKATTGAGTTTMYGIVPASTLGKTATAKTVFTADELLDLKYSVDEAYARAWMMKRATKGALRKLKDSNGQYLWQPSLQVGAPATFDGDPIYENTDMPAATGSLKPVLYGDFQKYVIRQVNGMTVMRSEERYMEYNQVAFVGIIRADGNLVDAGTHPVKYLQMASS